MAETPTLRVVGVVGRTAAPGVLRTLDELAAALEPRGVEIRAETQLSQGGRREPFTPNNVDMIVSLGGDGTLLRGARLAAPHGVPVFGVNLGHLGFLTSIAATEMADGIGRLYNGDYWIDERLTFEVTVIRANAGMGETFLSLNDAVVHKGGLARIVRLAVEIEPDGLEIGTYSADGIIISTPTGSTAYSLSAGGPIVVPTVDCILATPICPHSLVVRPIVLPVTASIAVRAVGPVEGLILTVDGQDGAQLQGGDRVVIRRGPHTVRLIRFSDENFFSTMRQKLHWGVEPVERA